MQWQLLSITIANIQPELQLCNRIYGWFSASDSLPYLINHAIQSASICINHVGIVRRRDHFTTNHSYRKPNKEKKIWKIVRRARSIPAKSENSPLINHRRSIYVCDVMSLWEVSRGSNTKQIREPNRKFRVGGDLSFVRSTLLASKDTTKDKEFCGSKGLCHAHTFTEAQSHSIMCNMTNRPNSYLHLNCAAPIDRRCFMVCTVHIVFSLPLLPPPAIFLLRCPVRTS